MTHPELTFAQRLLAQGRSTWDGDPIDRRKECDGCRFNLEIFGEERCYWGIAWKLLRPGPKLAKCPKLNGPSPREEKIVQKIQLEERWGRSPASKSTEDAQ